MEFKPSQALSISVLNQDNEQRFYWIEDNDQIQTIYEASDRDSDRHKLSKKIRSFEGKYSKNKVGCAFPMVRITHGAVLRRRQDAPHFIVIILFISFYD